LATGPDGELIDDTNEGTLISFKNMAFILEN